MIKFTGMSSEHKAIPESCMDKSEFRKNNETPNYLRWDYVNGKKVDNGQYSIYCTYAWISTDEIDTEDFPIAVMDYKPSYSKRSTFIFSEPIWNFIKDERTPQQQQFIERNFDKLNDLFIDFAKSQGYLETVK